MTVDLVTLTLAPAAEDSQRDRDALSNELQLLAALERDGLAVLSAGSAFCEADQIAQRASQWREHANNAVEFRPPCVLLNLLPGVSADDVAACVRYLARELQTPPRLILYGRVPAPGLQTTTLLACHARLKREGYSTRCVLGVPSDTAVVARIRGFAEFDCARAAAVPAVAAVRSRLQRTRFLSLGPLGDPQLGIHPATETLCRALGPDLAPLRPQHLEERVATLMGDPEQPSVDLRIRRVEEGTKETSHRGLARLFAIADLLRENESDGLLASGPLEGPGWGTTWKHLPSGVGAGDEAWSPLLIAARTDIDTLVMQRCLRELDHELPRVEATAPGPAPAVFARVDGLRGRRLQLRASGPFPVEFEAQREPGSSWTVATWIRDGHSYRAWCRELALVGLDERTVQLDGHPLEDVPPPHLALIPGAHGAALAELAATMKLPFDVVPRDGHREQ